MPPQKSAGDVELEQATRLAKQFQDEGHADEEIPAMVRQAMYPGGKRAPGADTAQRSNWPSEHDSEWSAWDPSVGPHRLSAQVDPMASIKGMGVPESVPRGTFGEPAQAPPGGDYRAFLPKDIDGLPIDNDGEAATPVERAAIMNLGMSNDDIEKLYRQAGMHTIRDRIGRVHLVDQARGVAVPIINDEKSNMSDMALPVAEGVLAGAAGGGAGSEAEGALMGPVRWAGRSVLGRALKAGAAQFAGEEAFRGGMRAATGKQIPMDVAGAAERGAGTAALQAGMEGGGRAVAMSGGVSPRVSNETMRAGPIEKLRRTSPFGVGAITGEQSPEMEVGRGLLGKISDTMAEKTASRQAAEDIIGQATKQKVKIPVKNFMVALSKRGAALPLGGSEKRETRQLIGLWNDIKQSYLLPKRNGVPVPGGAMRDFVSPEQAETIRQSLYKIARFDKNGDPTLFEKAARDLYGKFREDFYGSLQPLGAEQVKTKRFMDTMEEIKDRVSAKNPETFVREMFGWDAPNKQSNLDALRQAEKYLGTNGKIEGDIRRLVAKRQWSDADRGLARGAAESLDKVRLSASAGRAIGKYMELGGRPLAAWKASKFAPQRAKITSQYPGVYASEKEPNGAQ
jgi:hypothetical protein